MIFFLKTLQLLLQLYILNDWKLNYTSIATRLREINIFYTTINNLKNKLSMYTTLVGNNLTFSYKSVALFSGKYTLKPYKIDVLIS